MAILSLKQGERKTAITVWLVVTVVLGAGLLTLTLELCDFVNMIAEGDVPQRIGWLGALWALVGLHGLHVTVRLSWLAVMLAQIAVLGLTDQIKSRLLLLGLYGHFLGLVWIGIFTIVYLWRTI